MLPRTATLRIRCSRVREIKHFLQVRKKVVVGVKSVSKGERHIRADPALTREDHVHRLLWDTEDESKVALTPIARIHFLFE